MQQCDKNNVIAALIAIKEKGITLI